MTGDEPPQTTEAFWEDFWSGRGGRFTGEVNAALAEEAADLPPGRALELGCGSGGDAIWLAGRGWAVTATDVAQAALDAAAAAAAAAGVRERITFERHDLAASMPDGEFDLVTSAFLHSPVDFPWAAVLRAAAARVAPGGTLLIVTHAPSPEHAHHDLPDLDAVVAAPGVAGTDGWTLRTRELRPRRHAFRGEAAHDRVDAVVRFERGLSPAGGPAGAPAPG